MQRDIEVELTFLPPEHGGRSKPASSGYRAQFYYDGRDWDARHHYPDAELVEPGQKVRAFVAFLSPLEHIDRVYSGMGFLVREGNRTVGYGVIKGILDLPKSAEKAEALAQATSLVDEVP